MVGDTTRSGFNGSGRSLYSSDVVKRRSGARNQSVRFGDVPGVAPHTLTLTGFRLLAGLAVPHLDDELTDLSNSADSVRELVDVMHG